MSTTWIVILSAAGAAAAALALAAVVRSVSGRRTATSAGPRRDLESDDARSEGRVTELEQELERAEAENRRSRRLAAIGTTIDLDAVLARTLEAAAALPLVDAAAVVLPQDGREAPLVATVGISSEEAVRHAAALAANDGARAVSPAHPFGQAEAAGEAGRPRRSLIVPLPSEADDAIGSLAAFWHDPSLEPSEDDVAALEDLAASAGPAIDHARRFREARKLADLDALTNLHNRRYFHETLAREVARAHRYDRRLALVVFDIDDFKSINDQIGHLAGDSVLSELAERVRSVVRSADIACRVGGDEFAIILPESTLADAEQLYRRLGLAVSTRPTGGADRLRISAGIAELRPGDDLVSFFERADEALYRAKGTGKGQSFAAGGSSG